MEYAICIIDLWGWTPLISVTLPLFQWFGQSRNFCFKICV